MSTDIVRRAAGDLAMPAGARQLGARVKPIIRLGMGVKVEGTRRDGSTYTRPDKTDYFTVRGDERAIAKFRSVYGEKPKAIKLMVPSSLPLALDISYRSFVGGQSDDGGRPLALGFTNFAPLGYAGGPDILRVWRGDGSYDEVETLGLDEAGKPIDEIARDLNIELYATFTFTIPDVLGWGSFAQITSKGKKSADNLAFKLSEIYGAFGSKAPWAFDREQPPMLVIKPDTALMRFEKDGDAGWAKSKIFVLDIVIPESFHDMQDRLVAHERELAPRGASEALYGTPTREPAALSAAGNGTDESTTQDTSRSADVDADHQQAEPAATEAPSAAGSAPDPDDEFVDVDEIEFGDGVGDHDAGRAAAAQAAAEFLVPAGSHAGKTLQQVLELGPTGESWLRAAARRAKSPEYRQTVIDFCRVYLPDAVADLEDAAS